MSHDDTMTRLREVLDRIRRRAKGLPEAEPEAKPMQETTTASTTGAHVPNVEPLAGVFHGVHQAAAQLGGKGGVFHHHVGLARE